MPLVKINMLKGKSPEYKKIVLESVHNGLVASLGIEDWDRFQRIIEYEKLKFSKIITHFFVQKLGSVWVQLQRISPSKTLSRFNLSI